MEILITKKAKEQMQKINKKELKQLREFIKDMKYTGVAKGKLDNGKFYTVDFYRSEDNKCVISEFFVHHHENDSINSYLDFINARTNDKGEWLV